MGQGARPRQGLGEGVKWVLNEGERYQARMQIETSPDLRAHFADLTL